MASGMGLSRWGSAVGRGLLRERRALGRPATAAGAVGRAAASTGGAAASSGKDGKRAGAGGKAAKEDLRQDDSKYRQMLSVLYPKDPRPQKLPLPDADELERRAVLAKLWSRYAVRRAHVEGKEIHRFIEARQAARKELQAVYPEAMAAADAKNAADSEKPFPVERRMPTTTPPLPAAAAGAARR